MRIIYISDIHGKLGAIERLPEADLCLVGGDFTTLGGASEVRAVVEAVARRYPAFLGVLGNMDLPEAQGVLSATGHLLPEAPADVSGIRMLGLGGANRSPFNTPNEWDEACAEARFSGLAEGTLEIAVTHAPPFESGADRIGGGLSVGSRAVAAMVKAVKPALLLCGHIHEAAGIFQFGESIVVNPGAFGDEGHYAEIRWEPGGKPSVWLATALATSA